MLPFARYIQRAYRLSFWRPSLSFFEPLSSTDLFILLHSAGKVKGFFQKKMTLLNMLYISSQPHCLIVKNAKQAVMPCFFGNQLFGKSAKFVFAGCACTHFAPLYCLDDNNHSALFDKQKTKHPHKTKRSATVGSLERRFVLLIEFLIDEQIQDLKQREIK